MKAVEMHFFVMTIILSCTFVPGMVITRKTNDWPLQDCQGMDIDLVLVADGATATPGLIKGGEHYRRQMKFFSQLIDLFSNPHETNLTRLRVSVAASTVNESTNTPIIESRIQFNSYLDKAELKRAIENDSIPTSSKSYPLTVAMEILTTFFNDTANGARENAEKIMIMVIDGGRPFQITKKDSDFMGIFNTTKAKFSFVLVGVESGINLQTVFPANNYVKVKTTDNLANTQSIPVRLCKSCYPGWFKLETEEPEIEAIRISCYKLFKTDDSMNWLDASERCEDFSTTLVSIESRRELAFLKEKIPEEIKTLEYSVDSPENGVNVYIGLTRRRSSLGRRFRWLNTTPLILTHWGNGEPSDGTIQACVVWNFSATIGLILNVEGFNNTNFTLGGTNITLSVPDYWASVGCGFTKGEFYLCESENKVLTGQNSKEVINIDRPSNKSIKGAVEKGELAFYSGRATFVSVSGVQISTTDKLLDPSLYSAFLHHRLNETMSLNFLELYPCEDSGQTYVPYALLCDFIAHCPNRRDESVCQYRECDTRSETRCSSGQCVQSKLWCDLHPDCIDKSDEEECTVCQHSRCPDGRCLPHHWLGDGEVDCSSCSSEGSVEGEMEAAKIKNIAECVFTCNRTQCVYISMLNNGIIDCTGPEGKIDETIGALMSTSCYTDLDMPEIRYSNWAPKCVYIKDRYQEPLGCRDMTHLQNCEDFICPEGYFKCPSSYCIPTHYVQNDEFDCPYGEDEEDIYLQCPGHFVCAASDICLHPDLVCDNFPHCPEGDDELNCNVICRKGFLCLGGAVVVHDYDIAVPLLDFSFVDPRTRYLDVSGVNVSRVFPAFPKNTFTKLVHAKLRGCSITHLDAPPATQNELRGLLWIDLSYNFIERVSVTAIFRYMIGLKSLNLSHNEHLIHLHNDAFNTYSTTSSLVELDLSYTGLTAITSDVFASLNKLERLNLRNTRITDIRLTMFPEGFELEELDLRGIVVQHLYADMFKRITVTSTMYTSSFKLCCPQLHNDETAIHSCQAPKDPFSSCSDLISLQILRILLWVNGFLAVLGNVIVIVYRIFFDRKILKMAYGHFVTHLSFADLCMGIYLIIVAIADAHYRGTFVWAEQEWRNSVVCKVAGFLSTLSSETSTLFIAFITLDRFLVIRYPFGQLKISGRFITACCILNWTIGFVLALIPLLPPLEHWTVYNSNGMCLGLPLTTRRQPGWQFSTAVFIFFNFFLFVLIAVGQVIIYRTMADMRMNQGALTNVSKRRAQDLAVAKHLSLIAITDFMCWFPIGVMGLLALDGYEINIEAYSWSAVLVLPVNSALNPLLYTIPAVTQKWKQFKDDTSCHHSKTLD